ncbi:MAG TPA: class I adenylate-forming enzyme family protein [Spirochaetota bacterium]|nr:class I adenylate-forming enzyme family protein [Spirochaetota bacterium]
MNLNNLLNYTARLDPQKTAIIESKNGQKITYKELVENIEKYSIFFINNGILPNENVGLKLKNSIEWIVTFYALIKIGANPVLIDPLSTPFETEEYLKIANSKTIITKHNDKIVNIGLENVEIIILSDENYLQPDIFNVNLEKIKHSPNIINNSYSNIILFTYRGFGYPLGVLYNEKSLILSIISNISASRINNKSIVAHLLPSTHIFGLSCNILSTLLVGGTVAIINNTMPKEMLKNMEFYKINFLVAVPTIIKILLDTNKKSNFNLAECKRGIVGGNSFNKLLFESWKDMTNGGTLIQGYGLTETSPILCNLWNNHNPESLGKPMRNCNFLILDKNKHIVSSDKEGTLFVKNNGLFCKYINRKSDDLFYKEYFDTGDIVYKDKEEFYFFVKRDKDIAKIGGTTVDINEIINTLNNYEKKFKFKIEINDDPIWQEKITLTITGNQEITKEDILEHLRKKLNTSKIPKDIIITTG